MSKLQPYPQYKDSGVEWLGAVPEGWEVRKIKYVFDIQSGNGFPVHLQGENSGDIPFFKVSDINSGKKYTETANNYVSHKVINANNISLIMRESILTAKIGAALLKNHRTINKVPCSIDNNMLAMTPKQDISIDFLYEVMKVVDFKELQNHGTIPSINMSLLKSVFIPVPDEEDQINISDFLIREKRKIDNLISKFQQQIQLLQEYRQKIITQAVTCGLDAEGNLRKKPEQLPADGWKDSGVEWLGAMPEGWEVLPVRSLYSYRNDRNHADKELLSVYREYGVIKKDSRDDNHNVASLDLSNYKFVKTSDLVVNKMKTWQGSLGISKYTGIVSPAYFVLKPISKKISPRFINYLLRNKKYVEYYDRISYGVRVGQWDMHMEDFKTVPVILPSKEKQEEIANFIEEKMSNIDVLISKFKQQIQLLQEKKQVLVSNLVTGKVKPEDKI